jgi:hypothetical protein
VTASQPVATRSMFAGSVVESCFALSAPSAPADAATDVVVVAAPVDRGGDWTALFETTREQTRPDGWALWIDGIGCFHISSDCSIVTADVESHSTPDLIDHALLDIVLAARFGIAGEPVLHATAIEVDGGALCLVGPTGTGKSTLTAAACVAGARFVADDCARLRPLGAGYAVVPSYPGSRLYRDSVVAVGASTGAVVTLTGKTRVDHHKSATTDVPVRAIVRLDRGTSTEPRATRLKGPAALDSLLSNAAVGCRAGGNRALFERFVPIVASVPVLSFAYPDDLARLGEVAVALLDVARSDGSPLCN